MLPHQVCGLCGVKARLVKGSKLKIAIYGLGYVGLTAAGCLTSQGHEVVGVDVSESKISDVNNGVSPIIEPGLPELLLKATQAGKLKATANPGPEIASCDMAIVCVGTPSANDGSHNMSYIAEVTRQIAMAANVERDTPLTVVYRSTVRPGTMEELVMPIFSALLGPRLRNIELVYNPEFLRESVAIHDFFNPPKIVIGTADGQPSVNMDRLNEGLTAPVFYTGFRESEITKFVDNTFHALKVAFANEVGRICLNLNISATKIHEIFVSDTKLNISPYYLKPGGAFGGSCLPKDVRALQFISGDIGANTHVIDSVLRSNEAHKRFLFDRCAAIVPKGAKVLLIGLAFKGDTDDLRESPNLDLARRLLQAGYKLSVFDPALKTEKLVGQNLGYAYSNLPQLSELLVDDTRAREIDFDLIIDSRGTAKRLNFRGAETIDINDLN